MAQPTRTRKTVQWDRNVKEENTQHNQGSKLRSPPSTAHVTGMDQPKPSTQDARAISDQQKSWVQDARGGNRQPKPVLNDERSVRNKSKSSAHDRDDRIQRETSLSDSWGRLDDEDEDEILTPHVERTQQESHLQHVNRIIFGDKAGRVRPPQRLHTFGQPRSTSDSPDILLFSPSETPSPDEANLIQSESESELAFEEDSQSSLQKDPEATVQRQGQRSDQREHGPGSSSAKPRSAGREQAYPKVMYPSEKAVSKTDAKRKEGRSGDVGSGSSGPPHRAYETADSTHKRKVSVEKVIYARRGSDASQRGGQEENADERQSRVTTVDRQIQTATPPVDVGVQTTSREDKRTLNHNHHQSLPAGAVLSSVTTTTPSSQIPHPLPPIVPSSQVAYTQSHVSSFQPNDRRAERAETKPGRQTDTSDPRYNSDKSARTNDDRSGPQPSSPDRRTDFHDGTESRDIEFETRPQRNRAITTEEARSRRSQHAADPVESGIDPRGQSATTHPTRIPDTVIDTTVNNHPASGSRQQPGVDALCTADVNRPLEPQSPDEHVRKPLSAARGYKTTHDDNNSNKGDNNYTNKPSLPRVPSGAFKGTKEATSLHATPVEIKSGAGETGGTGDVLFGSEGNQFGRSTNLPLSSVGTDWDSPRKRGEEGGGGSGSGGGGFVTGSHRRQGGDLQDRTKSETHAPQIPIPDTVHGLSTRVAGGEGPAGVVNHKQQFHPEGAMTSWEYHPDECRKLQASPRHKDRDSVTPHSKFLKDDTRFYHKEYLAESLDFETQARQDRSNNSRNQRHDNGPDRLGEGPSRDVSHAADVDGLRASLRELSAKVQLKRMEEEGRFSSGNKNKQVSRLPQPRRNNSQPSNDRPKVPEARERTVQREEQNHRRSKNAEPTAAGRDQNHRNYPDVRNNGRMFRDPDSGIADDDDFDWMADLDDMDIEEAYEGGDKYVFYLQTDEGGIIGPLKFDVEDIVMGLPGGTSSFGSGSEDNGLRNRQTGSHGLNEFSSRSHSVLTVTIDSETQPDTEDENLYVTKRGKLSFVDLAGSEKVKDASGSFGGPGMLESNSINKSLLVLGNCISHLGDAKRRQGHIPYRDSKLTKLLSDSLGGHGITLMIACITPSSSNITETMNTLRYASRAKKIKTKPTVKMDPREKLILSLKREIKVLRNENHYLRQQLEFPAKPKGQLQKENDEKFMKFMKEQKEKESGLYEMLQEYMVENEALRAENSEMHSTRDKIRREQQLLYRENEKLMKRLEDMEKVVSQNPAMWATAQHKRTDGYGQYDLISPRGSPIGPGYHSGHSQKGHPPLAGSPPGSRGKGPPGPMKPPHRLPDPVMRPAQRPIEVVENGATYPNNGYTSPRAGPRQTSPTRQMERKASQLSTTDAIHSMNEQLKREVMQLEGQIRHHQYVAERSGEMSRVHGSSVR